MSPLEQLIMKKMQEGKRMSPLEQKAKMDNLDALKAEMHGMMKGHLAPKGAAHLEVEADSPEALKDGLDEAKDALSSDDESSEDAHEGESEDGHDDEVKPAAEPMIAEQIEHESMEGDLSPEELDQLQMLLAKLKARKS